MKRCSRCGFLSEPRIPVGDDGICLWCRLSQNKVPLAAFYENGDWQKEIDWHGYALTPADILRDQVQAAKNERGHTVKEIARQTGVSEYVLSHFLNDQCQASKITYDRLTAYVEQ